LASERWITTPWTSEPLAPSAAVLAIAAVLTEAPPIRRGAGPVMVAAARTSDRPAI
jgi:hypothetical protein